MNYLDLLPDMQEEVKKLVNEYPDIIEDAYKYYMMGGYEHGKTLCKLKSLGLTDDYIRIYNHSYWIQRNKKLQEELYKLLPWYSKLWIKIKEFLGGLYE